MSLLTRSAPAILYTEDPGGGRRQFLDRLVPGLSSAVSGLVWRTAFPGGDTSFQASLSVAQDLSHVGLNLGRKAVIQSGGAIRFQGSLGQAARGTPWQLQGPGLAAAVVSSTGSGGFMAVESGGNAFNLDAVVTQAISRGLPWTKAGTLPTAGQADSASVDINSAFDQVGKALAQAWSLSPLGVCSMAALPTAPSYVLRAPQPLTPQLIGYTQGVGLYSNGSSNIVITDTTHTDAIGRWGHIEGFYDMTGLGTLSGGTAATYLSNWLTANIAAPSYTNAISVQYGQLRSVSGSSHNQYGGNVDLGTVRAGCIVTVYDVDPDHSHLLAQGPLQMLVTETEYAADPDVLTLTPAGCIGQDLSSIIYQSLSGAL